MTKNKIPGYWCQKLQEWYEKQQKSGLVDIKFDIPAGDHDVEEVAKEAYEVLSGQRKCVDITDEIL